MVSKRTHYISIGATPLNEFVFYYSGGKDPVCNVVLYFIRFTVLSGISDEIYLFVTLGTIFYWCVKSL